MSKIVVNSVVNSPIYSLRGLVVTDIESEASELWPYTCRYKDGSTGLFGRDEIELSIDPTDYKFEIGDKLKLVKRTRTFAAAEGAEAVVTSKPYYSSTCESVLVDVQWLKDGYHQAHGGYNPADFDVVERVAVEPVPTAPTETKKALAPQTAAVLDMIRSTGRVTGVQAWNVLKVRSLPRRIADLKEAGFKVVSTMRTDHLGQRYAEYTIAA